MITEEHTIFIFLGEALSGHVISVHQTSGEIHCTRKCLSNPKCASFNFEIQQSRSLSTCELNTVSRTSDNKLESRHGFAYYEPLTPRERPKQERAPFSPTTSNLITEAVTTQGTQEVSPNQGEAATPASSVPSTEPATIAAPGKWPPNQGYAFNPRQLKAFGRFFLKPFPQFFFYFFFILRQKFSVAWPKRRTCGI